MYTVIYKWGCYESESFDKLMDAVKLEGNRPIETVEKVLVNETEHKLSARFYYIRED